MNVKLNVNRTHRHVLPGHREKFRTEHSCLSQSSRHQHGVVDFFVREPGASKGRAQTPYIFGTLRGDSGLSATAD